VEKTVRLLHGTRIVSPSAHPRPASGGATDFFPASALSSPTGLATSRCRRRAMRPTDVCHPIELRAPAPRVFPVRSRHFRGGEVPRRLRLHATTTGGPDVSRRPTTASADRTANTNFELYCLTAWRTNVGVFFPRCCCDRASDIPVATSVIPAVHLVFTRLFGETEDRQDRRRRRLVKACAAFRSGTPSIGRDSS
jgi:hypothetical protein